MLNGARGLGGGGFARVLCRLLCFVVLRGGGWGVGGGLSLRVQGCVLLRVRGRVIVYVRDHDCQSFE